MSKDKSYDDGCRCWNEGQWGRVHREDCPVHGPTPCTGAYDCPAPKHIEGCFSARRIIETTDWVPRAELARMRQERDAAIEERRKVIAEVAGRLRAKSATSSDPLEAFGFPSAARFIEREFGGGGA